MTPSRRLFATLNNASTTRQLHVNQLRRSFRSVHNRAAVVAGAGPAGLAVVGNLLEHLEGPISWVDPDFNAGKLNKEWREVPSNTKVNLFVAFAEAVEPFRKIISSTPTPNALTHLKGLKQDSGCSIAKAADMCLMLSQGVRKLDRIESNLGQVTGADWDDASSTWTVQIQAAQSSKANTISASRLVFCTGSEPDSLPIPIPGLELEKIHLDIALTPSQLSSTIPSNKPTTVAVIGGSHSAILVLLNLYSLASTSHSNLRVKWFVRNKLQYAVPKDGWILYDNTGLKGQAADFARENLEDDKLPTSPAGKFIEKVDVSHDARSVYQKHLTEATHIVHATGFANNPLPKLSKNGKPMRWVQYDHKQGGFLDTDGKAIKGLHGAGIAFPEQVTDPAGNVEYAVGLWKFMKYLKRVTVDWAKV